jgi:accessory gene regulator protein AgrB
MTISYFVVDFIRRIILERIVEFVVTLLISRVQGIMKLEVNTTILATSPGLITLHR